MITSNLQNFTNDESPTKEYNFQIPKDSNVYYEDTTGDAWDIYISGDYAYIADKNEGLAIINISDPTNPGTPVYANTTGEARGVYISGNYAYVADSLSGLAIINITDPTNPGTPVYVETDGWAMGVCISGNYAYVADHFKGMAVIDISDPTKPGTPDYESTTGEAMSIYVSGDYAYIANFNDGLAVMNISDPTNPGEPVYEETSGLANDVYVSGDYAYVADTTSGLAVIDISDPTNPGEPVYENTTGSSYSVYVSGDYAYVADWLQGLAIIDISDPTNPGTPVYEDTTGSTADVYVSGIYAYLADNNGLAIIQIQKRIEIVNPIITNNPSDFTVEFGYTGQSLSWTATDLNPDTYTIELQGTGIVEGPTNWESGIEITYDIPNGFTVGDYIYTVNFTDYFGNFITESVTFSVDDTTYPTITDVPSDLIVESGYTGQSLSWTAIDLNPDTYTIDLQSTGIVEGPITWESGIEITYDIPDGFIVGDYIYTVNFTDDYGNYETEEVTFSVDDTTNPTITNVPDNLTVEFGYTGQTLSWTATDPNPNIYTIELQGTGIVEGPTTWESGIEITFDIPDGFDVNTYVYTVNFTDDYGNFETENVTFSVGDTTDPTITNVPDNLILESGYTGQIVSWTATDPNPNTYTIELQGTGIVEGPTTWTSGIEITFDIPDGLDVNAYVYTVNFTDDYGNFETEDVIILVGDTTDPTITDAPSDFGVELGYTDQSILWIATDHNPGTCTIELQGTGIVEGPIIWTSGSAITYDIPDGFDVGDYIYTVNFTDDYGNFINGSMIFTVGDTANPFILNSPNDIIVESGYLGQKISWNATDLNPNTYTIELQGTGIITVPTTWSSGVEITYDIPEGFNVGVYVYTVNFSDDYGNFVVDSIAFTVEDTISPSITNFPIDFTVEFGYTGQNISWTANDLNPYIYTIELNGSEIVAGPTTWSSGVEITYDIPDDLAAGVYVYTITFTDDSGNLITDSVTFTVEEDQGGNPGVIIAIISIFTVVPIFIIATIIIKKRKKKRPIVA